MATDAIVVSFNTSIRGSVFDQLLFRPGNWNGEKGEQQLRVEVDKFESPLLRGLLLIGRPDKANNVTRDKRRRDRRQTTAATLKRSNGVK